MRLDKLKYLYTGVCVIGNHAKAGQATGDAQNNNYMQF